MFCYRCMTHYEDVHGNLCSYCGYYNKQPEKYPGALSPGTLLCGRYLIGIVLDRDYGSLTYAGLDKRTGHRVRIRELFPSPNLFKAETQFQQLKKKILKEAIEFSAGSYPGIARLFNSFEANGTAYTVWEWEPQALSLSHYVRNHGSLTEKETVTLFTPILETMASFHREGRILLYRFDLLNLVINDARLVLLDYFLPAEQHIIVERTNDGDIILDSLKPLELYQKKMTHIPATDLYIISAVMYYALTGKMPLEAPDRMLSDTLQPPSVYAHDISPDLEKIILKGLALRAGDRYRNAGEMLDAVQGKKSEKREKVLFPFSIRNFRLKL